MKLRLSSARVLPLLTLAALACGSPLALVACGSPPDAVAPVATPAKVAPKDPPVDLSAVAEPPNLVAIARVKKPDALVSAAASWTHLPLPAGKELLRSLANDMVADVVSGYPARWRQ